MWHYSKIHFFFRFYYIFDEHYGDQGKHILGVSLTSINKPGGVRKDLGTLVTTLSHV